MGSETNKRVFKIVNGSTPESGNDLFWDGDIVWITPDDLGDLNSKYIVDSLRRITSQGYSSCGTRLCPPGSIIISTRAPIGHLGITKVATCTNQGCRTLIARQGIDVRYFYFFMKSMRSLIEAHGNGSTYLELSRTKLGYFIITFPPLPEQQAIADFLDGETTRINTIIEKQNRLIELLKEKRSALITQAVTKGLDPNVKTKPSGVEWIGEIPERWDVRRLKFISKKIRTGSTPKSDVERYYNGDVPWFTPESYVYSSKYLETPAKYVSHIAISEGEAKLYNKDSIFFVGIGATIGKVAMVGCVASCNQQINVIEVVKHDHNYLFFCLKALEKEIIKFASFTTLPILNQNKTGQLTFCLPPLPEQQVIVDFLDRETEKIDTLISKIQKQIDLLNEYKQSLITAAVTGKIDVRDNAYATNT